MVIKSSRSHLKWKAANYLSFWANFNSEREKNFEEKKSTFLVRGTLTFDRTGILGYSSFSATRNYCFVAYSSRSSYYTIGNVLRLELPCPSKQKFSCGSYRPQIQNNFKLVKNVGRPCSKQGWSRWNRRSQDCHLLKICGATEKGSLKGQFLFSFLISEPAFRSLCFRSQF